MVITNKKQNETQKAYYRMMIKKLKIVTYTPKKKLVYRILRSVAGVASIGLGLGTSLIPFTSVPLYVLGGALLGFDILAYYKAIKKRLCYELHIKKIILNYKIMGLFQSP